MAVTSILLRSIKENKNKKIWIIILLGVFLRTFFSFYIIIYAFFYFIYSSKINNTIIILSVFLWSTWVLLWGHSNPSTIILFYLTQLTKKNYNLLYFIFYNICDHDLVQITSTICVYNDFFFTNRTFLGRPVSWKSRL